MNIFKRLAALSMLVIAVPALGQEVKSAGSDLALKAELAKSPLLAARVAQISAEWRAVETDVLSLSHDKNILSRLLSVPRLLRDTGILERDVAGAQKDAALAAEVAASPLLTAHLQVISAEWRAVEEELQEVKTG
jgi:hypothetical protein